MLFIHNREPTVSLYQRNINWILLSKLLKWSLFGLSIIACYNALFSFSFFNLLKSFIWVNFWKLAKKLETWCHSRF